MKKTIITTQKELDNLKQVKKEQEVIIESSTELTLNFILEVYGVLKIKCKVNCSRRNEKYFRARENSSVEARGNSSVEAWGNSSVVAWGNSSVVARENSSVKIIFDTFKGLIKLFGYSACWFPESLKIKIEVK